MNRTTEKPTEDPQPRQRPPIAVQIDEVKPYEKRTLRAFVDFTLCEVGVRINGAMIHEKDGKRWVSMPSREFVVDGVTRWNPIVDFSSKEARWAVNDAVLVAYDRHIDALGGDQ